jgi:hypothetical protein
VPEQYYLAAQSLKEGEMLAEPVLCEGRLYLVRLDRKVPWSPALSAKLAGDPKKNERMVAAARSMALKKYFEVNAAEQGIAVNPDDHVRWCVTRGHVFTREELAALFRDITGRQAAHDNELSAFTESWVQAKMIEEADGEFAEARRALAEVKTMLDGAILLNALQKNIAAGVEVSEEEMLAEYQLNAESRYSQREYRQGVLVRTPLPYAQVRDRIRANLAGQRSVAAILKWRHELYTAKGVKIPEIQP